MNIKIVNAELGIASCSRNHVPGDLLEPSTIIFFYYQRRDWIVFNEEHRDHEIYLEFVQEYMKLDDRQRKVFIDQIDIPEVRKMIDTVNLILRIRRKRYRKMKAA
ncbi:hypothetical protein [Clostridium sp. Marseille-P2415]|uniref:hypothetical protein n=1 Tax=Clostridium sp. Marseille-P2415 TaxID=1805471 RepID=UPI001115A713|nr:hypothetical protein [Clostridium sp. Marseille-P2415]